MEHGSAVSLAVPLISAMITPALLILATASLLNSVLVRIARIVDRARALGVIAHDGTWAAHGTTPETLRKWLESHARRARFTSWSISLFFAAVVMFVCACLGIALDRATPLDLGWLPVALAIGGSLLLLAGGATMVAESRLAGWQVQEEIKTALNRLKQINA
jgi:Protein of unknown function (DUF2721)